MPRLSATSNPTNLIEIARKDIQIGVFETSGKRMLEIQMMDLSRYKLPNDALLFLVARAGNTSCRYPAGLVNAWSRGPFDISALDVSHVVRFRLLVRIEGSAQLIATAENLRLARDDNLESLIPIVPVDLGQRLWDLVIDDDGPVLKVNGRIFPSGASAESFPPFRALVLPEVLRRVLDHIASDPEKLSAEDSVWSDWGEWMKDIRISQPPDEESQIEAWLNESTALFCDAYRFADDMEQAAQSESKLD